MIFEIKCYVKFIPSEDRVHMADVGKIIIYADVEGAMRGALFHLTRIHNNHHHMPTPEWQFFFRKRGLPEDVQHSVLKSMQRHGCT